MNETTIVVVRPHDGVEIDDQIATHTSSNPCVVTAMLTSLLILFPAATVKERKERATDTTAQAWGTFRTVITVTVPKEARG